MIKFEVYDKKIDDIDAEIELIVIVDKNFNHRWIQDKNILEKCGFKGKEDEAIFLPMVNRVYTSCKTLEPEDIRLSVSNAFKTIKNTTFKTIKMGLYTQNCPPTNTRALAEGILLGNYIFDKYKTEKNPLSIELVKISTEDYSDKIYTKDSIIKAIEEALVIADATNKAKDIVNTPPFDMTPEKLASYAKNMAKKLKNIECFIGDEEFLKAENMGAFLAVARASSNPAKLIHLTYKPKKSNKKFVFVGKGLTYDSGGLSLKPSEYMVTMKSDKSGASAALHIIKAASELNLPYEIHAIIGAAENMIGGNAYKPDDILKARNGKTIEVRNTDAEGRLVLADCLDYAQDLKPDYLIDMATLTGACVVALGEYTIGVMGHNEKLKNSILKISDKSGELCGTLPFNRYLKKLLKSDIADMSNISSSRYGGAITAGLFLDNFIRDEYKDKWLHLDIAGPAFVEKNWGYNQAGASGAGVRLCLYWLKEFVYKENSIHQEEL